MYEELYGSLPDKKAYLDRIGFEKNTIDSVNDLNLLVVKHLCTVPFENLDVLGSSEAPSIGIDDLFEKIVSRRRGGYCFELNALFFSLLQSMNVDSFPVLARILWNKTFRPPYSHRAAVASIEGKMWLCDVGYGGPCPVGILCLDTEDEQPVREAVFKVLKNDGIVTVFRKNEGEFRPMLEFSLIPADPVDFVPINYHIGMNPASYFRSKTIVSVHTGNGMKCIDGTEFRKTSQGEVIRAIEITDDLKMKSLLKEEFGIIKPEV